MDEPRLWWHSWLFPKNLGVYLQITGADIQGYEMEHEVYHFWQKWLGSSNVADEGKKYSQYIEFSEPKTTKRGTLDYVRECQGR